MTIIQSNYEQDWKQLLIPRIRDNQSWADLFNVMSDVYNRNIYHSIEQLRTLRNPTNQDRQTNIASAKFLGLDYNSDIFSDEEYISLITFLNKFNNTYKGTQSFIQFIGWIKNTKFQVEQLWAKGERIYEEFSEETPYIRNNSKIDDTGDKSWYPTSHIRLNYDGNLYNTDESEVVYLFYKIAPVNLVLKEIVAVFTADVKDLYLLTGDSYINISEVIPCIYKFIAPLYMNATCYTRSLYTSIKNFYAYIKDTSYQTSNFISYVKGISYNDYNAMGFNFSRNAKAEFTPKGSYYKRMAGANIPRLDYYPESRENHYNAKGILIEKNAINYLLDSENPSQRTVDLLPNTYTFSGRGSYTLYNIALNQTIGTCEDSELTFTLTEPNKVQVTPTLIDSNSRFQLEIGSYATSFIKTANSVSTRSADLLSYLNYQLAPATNGLYINLGFSDVKSNDCTLFKGMVDNANYIIINKLDNNINFLVYNTNAIILNQTVDFSDTLTMVLRKEYIELNNVVYNYSQLNGIIPSAMYFGSNQGSKAIDGYITEIEVYSVV